MAYPECSRGIWPEDTLDSLAYGLGWDNVEWYPFCQSGITALAKGGDTLRYHAALVVLPEYDMAAAVVSSGGVSTYNQMAAQSDPDRGPGGAGRHRGPDHPLPAGDGACGPAG